MKFYKKLSTLEKRIFLICMLACLFGIYLLSSYGDKWLMPDRQVEDTSETEIGNITSQTNDTRHRLKKEFTWRTAEKDQKIHIGDSIFSGAHSSAQVDLNNKNQVTVGEDSLVTFDLIDNTKVADLQKGNFRLKVDGHLKIAIQGEIADIHGDNSELQIFMGKNQKPQIKLLKGQATLQKKNQEAVDLGARKIASPTPPIQKTIPNPYTWKLYDLYDQKDFQLFEKDLLKIERHPEGAKFLDDIEPTLVIPEEPIPLISEATKVSINLTTKLKNPLGFVIQASSQPQFTPENSRIFWSSHADMNLTFFKPGDYYYRFKTVATNQELSTWSKTTRFTIFAPERPAPPRLIKAKKDGFVGDQFNMVWKSTGVKTRVEITDNKNEKVEELIGDQIFWTPSKAGKYKAQAWTVNSYGQESLASKPVYLNVQSKQITQKRNDQEPQRKSASVENTSSIKNQKPAPRNDNDKYNSTKIAINGFVWSLYSSEQYYSGTTSPVASGLGVHGYYWKGPHGFEGIAKTGVLGLNSTGSGQTALKDLEARYHYRFFMNSPWRKSRELQLSFFAGYEIYRNTGGLFASQYDLMKFGTALEFPWSTKWMAGGEFVFGLGTDKTQKKEVSGNVSYFFTPSWSLGLGYRIHLLEAGSTAVAPQKSLPYREGNAEGFSVLNYHY